MSDDRGLPRQDRRVSDRRRTYNRRNDDREISPPYFETFERIASALERIEALMRGGSVSLPDAKPRHTVDRP